MRGGVRVWQGRCEGEGVRVCSPSIIRGLTMSWFTSSKLS